MYEEFESGFNYLNDAIEAAVSGSDIQLVMKRLNYLKGHLVWLMQEIYNDNDEIPEQLREKLMNLEQRLESEVDKNMGELKSRLEKIQTSLIFLHSKAYDFCKDQTDMNANDVVDGLDVFIVAGTLMQNPFVSTEKICRYAIVPLIKVLGFIV